MLLIAHNRSVPYSVQAAANAVLRMAREAGQPITNMQVQKHVFLGQGYCLALLDKPLYYQNTHAWQFGPVVPKLYKALQKFGSGFVAEDLVAEDEIPVTSEEYEILQGVWSGYRKFTGSQLSGITHAEGSPWSKTWAENRFGIIPTDLIQAYYRDKLSAPK